MPWNIEKQNIEFYLQFFLEMLCGCSILTSSRPVCFCARLIDALEMMKHGLKRLLVPKSVVWKGMSKRFSILYNGKWLKNLDASSSSTNLAPNANRPSSSSTPSSRNKFCCLSREDVIRFVIGCLGALAPLPLSSISSLGAISPNYYSIEASFPAIQVTQKLPQDPSAVAVVESTPDGQYKIIGEISACKLWKCDYLAAAWALANLSAGQFVMGVEDNVTSRSLPHFSVNSTGGENNMANGGASTRQRKFSSRSIGFFSNPASPSFGASRSMYRGRSAPLTCKVTSSLAAVMAQMLSHRATHVWVTEAESEDILVGVVGYADILAAVIKQPAPVIPSTTPSGEGYATEIQNQICLSIFFFEIFMGLIVLLSDCSPICIGTTFSSGMYCKFRLVGLISPLMFFIIWL